MEKGLRIAGAALSAALAAAGAGAAPDVYDDARHAYVAGRYQDAYSALRTYRETNPGTLMVDDMIAIAACMLPDKRASGLQLLASLVPNYRPNPLLAAAIQQQITACSAARAPNALGAGTVTRSHEKDGR